MLRVPQTKALGSRIQQQQPESNSAASVTDRPTNRPTVAKRLSVTNQPTDRQQPLNDRQQPTKANHRSNAVATKN
jgi:hypothetical protein